MFQFTSNKNFHTNLLSLVMFGSVPLIQSVVLFVINLFNHNPHRGYISYNSDNEINNLDMNYH